MGIESGGMGLRSLRFFTAAALFALVAGVTSESLSASVRPQRLSYDMFTLPNGLTVVLEEDHSTPIAHLQLWYHVGSKNERPGRTGFAHLFEHLMFKGSKNVVAEGHTSYIGSIGGQSNAYTEEDDTVFWDTVPSPYLPLALWLEADRMATLKIDKQTFTSEREVVKEERRMRVDNQPYGNLTELIYDQTFTTHPYKHPVIGSMTDLEAASVDDVRDFYETYYVPENATLVLVGDFDGTQARQLVATYFGRVPKAAHAVPRDIPTEPPQTSERRVTLHEAWPLPVVIVAYHVPPDGHPDSYALGVLAKILTDGESSRLYQRLVYQSQIAATAFGQANLIEDPNLFYCVAVVNKGHTTEEAAAALLQTLDRVTSEPVTPHELERSKNQFARDYVMGRQTDREKALQLAHAVVIHHDITTADGEFDLFQRVSAEDVQRVARRYLAPENRTVMTVLPQ